MATSPDLEQARVECSEAKLVLLGQNPTPSSCYQRKKLVNGCLYIGFNVSGVKYPSQIFLQTLLSIAGL